MPWESKKQQRWGHSPAGKEALTNDEIEEFDDSTDFDAIPEEAASGPPKPKPFDTGKALRKVSRDEDPHKGKRRGGFHGTPKGKAGYTRKEKHKSIGYPLTPVDETYRGIGLPIAEEMNWSSPATGRPCGDDEKYPEKCGPGGGGGGGLSKLQVTDLMDLDQEYRFTMLDPNMRGPGAAHEREAYRNFYVEEKQRIKSPGYKGNIPVEDVYDIGEKDHDKSAPWGASMIEAALNWSTHKAETFKDTGEKGLHPAWGLKSIIDRGVKTHEKSEGDKRIGEAENSTQKRDIKGKSFKSYSMVHAFHWIVGKDLPFPGAAAPFGSKDEDDETETKTEESDE